MLVDATLLLLGLIWALAVAIKARSGSKSRGGMTYPAIFHYNEVTHKPTILLILQKLKDRDRVFAAFAEVAPDIVATE